MQAGTVIGRKERERELPLNLEELRRFLMLCQSDKGTRWGIT